MSVGGGDRLFLELVEKIKSTENNHLSSLMTRIEERIEERFQRIASLREQREAENKKQEVENNRRLEEVTKKVIGGLEEIEKSNEQNKRQSELNEK